MHLQGFNGLDIHIYKDMYKYIEAYDVIYFLLNICAEESFFIENY